MWHIPVNKFAHRQSPICLTVNELNPLHAIAPDKAPYCVFTQFRGPENAIKIHFCAYKNAIEILDTQFQTFS